MIIRNEAHVGASLGDTWRAVTDLARVAAALPGATLEPAGGGVFRGRMKVKLGPVTAEYGGTATLVEIDDDNHVVVYRVQGREVRGHGNASATIRIALSDVGSGTTLSISSDVSVSGIAAQLGGAMIENVSASLLHAFATRFDDAVSGRTDAETAAGDVLDVGDAARSVLARRATILGAYALGLFAVGAAGYALGRRR